MVTPGRTGAYVYFCTFASSLSSAAASPPPPVIIRRDDDCMVESSLSPLGCSSLQRVHLELRSIPRKHNQYIYIYSVTRLSLRSHQVGPPFYLHSCLAAPPWHLFNKALKTFLLVCVDSTASHICRRFSGQHLHDANVPFPRAAPLD